MAFFAPTALAGALLLALVLALAVDLGLAAGVDAFATLALVLFWSWLCLLPVDLLKPLWDSL
jgi:hypothetical protein